MDWALETIKEIQATCGLDDDATRAFCECFCEGSSAAAWWAFATKAEDELDKGGHSLYVFPDGSCYATWEDGIAAFGENVQDFEFEWIELMATRIHTVADLAAVYDGGVMSNDRGSGSGGPKYLSEEDIKDPDIGEAEIDIVTRDADPEAWELAEDAAKALGLDRPNLVGVRDVDLDPDNPYEGLAYQIIYAV